MLEILALAVIAVLGIASIEYENWFGGFVSFLAVGAAVQWWFQVPVWATALANPLLGVAALVAYVLIGLAYATMIRFPRWIRARETQIASAWNDYVRANPTNYSHDDFRKSYRFRDFTASWNSHRISSWAVLWPWGVAWDIINRPIRWIYRNLHTLFSGVLAAIERRAIQRASTKKGP